MVTMTVVYRLCSHTVTWFGNTRHVRNVVLLVKDIQPYVPPAVSVYKHSCVKADSMPRLQHGFEGGWRACVYEYVCVCVCTAHTNV